MLTEQISTLTESTAIDIAIAQTNAIVQPKEFNRATRIKILFYFILTSITVLAFSPNYNALPAFVSFSDLVNHTLAFTVLFLLLSQAYPPLSTRTIFIILFGTAVWIEIIQYFLPTRSSDWKDIAADATGMLIGYLLIYLFKRFRQTKTLYI